MPLSLVSPKIHLISCKPKLHPRSLAFGLAGLGLVLITACAGPQFDSSRYRFNTLITSEGLKLFEVLYYTPPRRIELERSSRDNTRPNSPPNYEKLALEFAEQTIEANGYCRSGYYILGRYAGETAQRIRGECKDRANQDDINSFTNTIAQW